MNENPTKQLKYIGYNIQRLNPKDESCIPEITIVELFNKEQDVDKLLYSILDSSNNINPNEFTERDKKIAMTMLQWFATNVGRSFHKKFLNEVNDRMDLLGGVYRTLIDAEKRFPDIRNFIKLNKNAANTTSE